MGNSVSICQCVPVRGAKSLVGGRRKRTIPPKKAIITFPLSTTFMMRLATGCLFLSTLSSLVSGSALTTPIAANERLCFYADVDKAGEKIGVRV